MSIPAVRMLCLEILRCHPKVKFFCTQSHQKPKARVAMHCNKASKSASNDARMESDAERNATFADFKFMLLRNVLTVPLCFYFCIKRDFRSKIFQHFLKEIFYPRECFTICRFPRISTDSTDPLKL